MSGATTSSSFRFQVASDIHRDGLGLELWENEEMVAEVFRCDADNSLSFSCWKIDIPFVHVERMVKLARTRLGEFENGEPLPPPVD
ncbi:hypothetical protein IHQ68_15080 [Chelatococcus sambhunathii]|uniref:Uncharacterized protein n=1 Tax=Chelatococcus sambhunathii TaxID=363953 RepID=A0ABU1DIM9_9HYPH|nr:hypothetical protein [Chelatococcus sambhunathii]MDR4307944.1 hypothetical protein [Chelatococcus sambhunathii]